MTGPVRRPNIVTDEHLRFLDELREGGTVNMASPEVGRALIEMYSLSPHQAREVHQYWMESFSERHPPARHEPEPSIDDEEDEADEEGIGGLF